ncbi:5-oxoprolinase subunit PxpB [Hyphococcus sp.]|uniref:5-oxoprolinase subunit PxpB n=1 Tax=Hyphococcus sp. TaxID=2038636 RepID=UPI0035C69464
MNVFSFSLTPFGENGWLATLSGGDMVARALAANAAADVLRNSSGVTDAVAGVESLILRFRPEEMTTGDAKKKLEDALRQSTSKTPASAPAIDIPVCYGGEYGPDFERLCEKLSLAPDQFIALHSSQVYRVLTVGFAPGFAYLGPLPPALQTGRLSTPRAHVPSGSVGVAGAMTGVYALASPGGWPLIGRTPKKLFDPHGAAPFIFTSGAAVRFVPIDEDAFKALEANPV